MAIGLFGLECSIPKTDALANNIAFVKNQVSDTKPPRREGVRRYSAPMLTDAIIATVRRKTNALY
jgi:hypothetical protein